MQALFCVYLLAAAAATIHIPVVQRNIPQHIKDLTAVYQSCLDDEATPYSEDECNEAVEDYSAAHIKVWDRAYIWQIGSQHDGSRLDVEWFGYCFREGAVLFLFCIFGPGVVAYFSRDDKEADKLAVQQWLVESAESTEPLVEESRVRVDMALEALNAGTIKALMLPAGSHYRPAVPPGMKVMEIHGDAPGAGWYIYNPTKLRSETIRAAAKAGTHNVFSVHYGESVAE